MERTNSIFYFPLLCGISLPCSRRHCAHTVAIRQLRSIVVVVPLYIPFSTTNSRNSRSLQPSSAALPLNCRRHPSYNPFTATITLNSRRCSPFSGRQKIENCISVFIFYFLLFTFNFPLTARHCGNSFPYSRRFGNKKGCFCNNLPHLQQYPPKRHFCAANSRSYCTLFLNSRSKPYFLPLSFTQSSVLFAQSYLLLITHHFFYFLLPTFNFLLEYASTYPGSIHCGWR